MGPRPSGNSLRRKPGVVRSSGMAHAQGGLPSNSKSNSKEYKLYIIGILNYYFPTPIKCSILLFSHGWETLQSSGYQCLSKLFFKLSTVWACFTQSGKLFQLNATRWLNWTLLCSRLPGSGMSTFSCPLTCLVDAVPCLGSHVKPQGAVHPALP